MSVSRLICLMLAALALVAAGCGDGDDGGSGGGGGASGEQGGGNGGDGGGNGAGDDSDEFAVQTELNLGQAFAEEPAYDGTLGPLTVAVRTDRGGGSISQPPITFTLTNSGDPTLEQAVLTLDFTVLPSEEPEDPPVPPPGDPPLDLAPQASTGTCATGNAISSRATISCELGILERGMEATITVTSPKWFRFRVDMHLAARSP